VAVRSKARAVSTHTLDRGFESHLGHGCLSAVCLWCVAVYRQRPCDGLIARLGCRETDREIIKVEENCQVQKDSCKNNSLIIYLTPFSWIKERTAPCSKSHSSSCRFFSLRSIHIGRHTQDHCRKNTGRKSAELL
jgi:hypothetical protein